MEYGYARVSTREQSEAAAADCVDWVWNCGKRNFRGQAVRKGFRADAVPTADAQTEKRRYACCQEHRPSWAGTMRRFWSSGASLRKEKRAAIVVLDMPLLDTRQNRDLTGTLIADIVLQLLSYVAQTEREFIRQRQAEGIAAAKARGVQFGRRPSPKPAEFPEWKERWSRGEVSACQAAKALKITHRTFLRWARDNADT